MGPGLGSRSATASTSTCRPDQPRVLEHRSTADALMVRDLVRSGHIDCFHSFGDSGHHDQRAHAARALDELESRQGAGSRSGIDSRGGALQLRRADSPLRAGAATCQGTSAPTRTSTCASWRSTFGRGRVTSVTRAGLAAFARRHPRAAVPRRRLGEDALAKECCEGLALPAWAAVRTRSTRPTRCCAARRCATAGRSGEFLRTNPYWGGVENAVTAAGWPTLRPGASSTRWRRGAAWRFPTTRTRQGAPICRQLPGPRATRARRCARWRRTRIDRFAYLPPPPRAGWLDWCRRSAAGADRDDRRPASGCASRASPPDREFEGMALTVPRGSGGRGSSRNDRVVPARPNPPDHSGAHSACATLAAVLEVPRS